MKVYGQRFAVIPEFVLYAPISSNAVRLWAIYQRHADAMGHAYPGMARLRELMGGKKGDVSSDTIQRAKAELVQAELIKVVARFDGHGRQTSDDIWLAPLKPSPVPQICGTTPRNLRGTGTANLRPSIYEVVEGKPDE